MASKKYDTDPRTHLTADKVQEMTMRTIKAHLKMECDFNDHDLKIFFLLCNDHPREANKLYRTGIELPKEDDWKKNPETLNRIMTAIIVKASKYGPMTNHSLVIIQG